MKLVSVQLGLAADSQLPNFYSSGYIGVCIFLQNLAETTHVQQATLAKKSVVIKDKHMNKGKSESGLKFEKS